MKLRFVLLALGSSAAALALGLHDTAPPTLEPAAAIQKRVPVHREYAPIQAHSIADPLQHVIDGPDPIAALVEIASDPHGELTLRGQAIAKLAQSEADANTDAALEQLRDRGKTHLIRAWAGSARLQRAHSLRDLANQAEHARRIPALNTPYFRAVERQLEDRDIRALVADLARYPVLQSAIAKQMAKAPIEDLVALTVRSRDDLTRRTGAGLLATKGQTESEAVGSAFIAAIAFAGGRPPWAGNALFIPGIPWTADQARELIGELIRWSIHCNENPLYAKEGRKIRTAMYSVGLLRVAGFKRGVPGDTEGMVRTWGDVAGQAARRDLLRDLDLSRDDRFGGDR